MLNKSNILKDYLNNIGTKNQLFFLFGHMPTPSTSNTSQSAIDSWKNSEMSYKVGRRDSIAVVPTNVWKSGYVYDYWKSKQVNTGNYYALNKTNNIVYLCVSNNSLNRKAINQFAEQLGIHPGIIVGRMQHEQITSYQNYNDLKEKYCLNTQNSFLVLTSDSPKGKLPISPLR